MVYTALPVTIREPSREGFACHQEKLRTRKAAHRSETGRDCKPPPAASRSGKSLFLTPKTYEALVTPGYQRSVFADPPMMKSTPHAARRRTSDLWKALKINEWLWSNVRQSAQDADIVLHRRRSLLVFADYGGLPPQQVAKRLLHDVPSNFRNRLRQGDILRTDFDAILGVSAFLNSAVSHQGGQALTLQCGARWMGVK